jgi:hypothetical protein
MKKFIIYLTIVLFSFVLIGCSNSKPKTPKIKTHYADLQYIYNEKDTVLTVQVLKLVNENLSNKEIVNTLFNKAASIYKEKGFKYMSIHKKNKIIPFYVSDIKNISRLCFNESKAKNEDLKVCKHLNLGTYKKTFSFVGLKEPIFDIPSYSVEKTINDTKPFLADFTEKNLEGTILGERYKKIFRLGTI